MRQALAARLPAAQLSNRPTVERPDCSPLSLGALGVLARERDVVAAAGRAVPPVRVIRVIRGWRSSYQFPADSVAFRLAHFRLPSSILSVVSDSAAFSASLRGQSASVPREAISVGRGLLPLAPSRSAWRSWRLCARPFCSVCPPSPGRTVRPVLSPAAWRRAMCVSRLSDAGGTPAGQPRCCVACPGLQRPGSASFGRPSASET